MTETFKSERFNHTSRIKTFRLVTRERKRETEKEKAEGTFHEHEPVLGQILVKVATKRPRYVSTGARVHPAWTLLRARGNACVHVRPRVSLLETRNCRDFHRSRGGTWNSIRWHKKAAMAERNAVANGGIDPWMSAVSTKFACFAQSTCVYFIPHILRLYRRSVYVSPFFVTLCFLIGTSRPHVSLYIIYMFGLYYDI